MNKMIYTLSIVFFTTGCFSQEETKDPMLDAYMNSNKKMIDEATPMIDFLLKYQDTSTTATQGDFNKLMSVYGVKESKDGMTKEQGFQIVDWYIKASEGPKTKNEKEEIDETKGEQFPKQTEEEELLEKAEDEMTDQVKSYLNNMSYEDFKELFKMAKPNASEAEIRREYDKMKNGAKKL